MNLLRIILIFFAIYFIRRAYQFYKFVLQQRKFIEEQQMKAQAQQKANDSIDAEYKVID